MKWHAAQKLLGVALAVYVVCDILLTPPAGIESRNPSHVTGVGIVGLALLFIGLATSVVAIVLLFRRPERAPLIGLFAALLFLPAFLEEQTGHFSSLPAPTGIEAVEIVQAGVSVIVIVLSVWMWRTRSVEPKNR
jgi:hypothetical protein